LQNFFENSPMDRNTGIGIVLLVALWGALLWYNQSQQKQLEKNNPTSITAVTDSLKNGQTANKTDSIQVAQADIAMAVDTISRNELMGNFSSFSSGEEQLITIENEVCIYTFSNKGGTLKTVQLKNYKTFDGKPLILFDAADKNLGVGFVSSTAKAPINTADLYFTTTSTSTKVTAGDSSKSVLFSIDLGNGKKYEHQYTIPANSHMLNYVINMQGFDELIPRNISYLTLDWKQIMPSQEGNIKDERMYSNVYYRSSNKEVDKLSAGKDDEQKSASKLQWVSYKQKFFNATLIAENFFENGTKTTARNDPKDVFVKEANTQFVIPYTGAKDFRFPMKFYFGPNKYRELKAAKIGLEEIIPLGWGIFGWVNIYLIIPIFNLLGKFIGNYGLIIFILTIIIKLITGPFTYKSYLSMIKMKVLKPEIDELKEKYGKEQQKFAAKQMELFRKAGVNPMGGCLPMLLQMPILLAMYRFFPSSIELRQEHFLWAKDLSHYDSIATLPFTIPGYGSHISLFAILMAISSFVYTKMNAASQPSLGGNEDPIQAQMRIFQYIMPFMLLFIFNSSSSALSYYYFLFNVTSIAQQWGMQKFLIDETKIHAQIQENKTKPVKRSKFQAKLEDMMKAQQEAQKRIPPKKK